MRRIAFTLTLAVVLAACGGGDSTDSSTPESGPDWPLTGVASASADVDVTGPVMVVKVDNVANALPQRGLSAADIVVEEPVEGGVTRLAVFVHSEVGGEMGPVRSVRSSDVGIVRPAGAVLVASGGAPEAVEDVTEAGIETRFEDTPGFSRDPSRSAPHDLFVDTGQAYAALDAAGPDGPFFEFGPLEAPDGAETGVAEVVLTFSPEHTTRLTREPDGWSRVLDTPDGFAADTVIALTVEQDTADYLDPSGAPVPINVTEGTGSGWMVSGDTVLEISWSKESERAPWTFSTAEGDLPVPPGRTFLALLPTSTGSLQGLQGAQTPAAQ